MQSRIKSFEELGKRTERRKRVEKKGKRKQKKKKGKNRMKMGGNRGKRQLKKDWHLQY